MTGPALRILHFSDLHLQDTLPAGLSWLLDKRLLGTLTQRLRRARTQDLSTLPKLIHLAENLKPDAIVYTGDLTTISLPGEFQKAMDYLAPLRKLVTPENFLFVPGNHDAYIDRPESVRALQQVNSQMANELNDIDFLPFKRKLKNVSFFLLNAARPRPLWNSGGVATPKQLQKLEGLLKTPREPGETRFIVSHFPVYDAKGKRLSRHRRMQGDMELRELLVQGLADGLLCGHIHRPFVYRLQDVMQICPGSLTIGHQAAVLEVNAHSIDATLLDINTNKSRKFSTAIHIANY